MIGVFRLSLALPVAAMMAGCTTVGTNVSGSFSCEAQEGRCARTQDLDNEALAEIAEGDAQAFVPAGPFILDDGVTPLVDPRTIAAREAQLTYEIAISLPGSSSGEGAGNEVVRTQVVLPGRGSVLDEAQRRAAPLGPTGLLAAARSAPSVLAFSTQGQWPAAPGAAPQQSNAIEEIRGRVEGKFEPAATSEPAEPAQSAEPALSAETADTAEPVIMTAGVFPNGDEQ